MDNSKQITKLANSKFNQFQTDINNINYIEKKNKSFF